MRQVFREHQNSWGAVANLLFREYWSQLFKKSSMNFTIGSGYA